MIEKCSLCGKCNKASILFDSVLRESVAPRFAAFTLLEKDTDPSLFRYILDGSSRIACPADIDLDEFVIRGRQKITKEGKQTRANDSMIAKVRMYGTPFPTED